MNYQQIGFYLFLYCDFCRQYYHRIPGGELIKVDNIDDYIETLKHPQWKGSKHSDGE
jgi:hypothetical protein